MRRAGKTFAIGGGVVVLALGGFGVYKYTQSTPVYDASSPASTPPGDSEAQKLAETFLTNWTSGSGEYQKAADATDSPAAARTGLRGYSQGLGLTSVTFSNVVAASAPDAAQNAKHVSFTVTAKVRGGNWSYKGGLDVLKSSNGGKAVHWAGSVLNPKLAAGESLRVGALPADMSQIQILGDDGHELTADQYPSLKDILTAIGKSGSDGTAATGVAVVDKAGKPVSALKVFTAAQRQSIPTTIDPDLEAAAEDAVKQQPESAVVALDYQTGQIKAVAYHGSAGNTAFLGSAAPGSTMKMVTAAAVIDKLGLTPSSAATCTPTIMAGGATFHNENNETDPGADLEHAFAISCNTAFIRVGYKMQPGDLADEAKNVFGIGTDWSIGGGVFVQDGSVPATPPDDATQAADLIGQGKVTMNSLSIASIAATIADAHYHQPIILPGQKQVPAARPISPSTAADVQQLMAAAASPGGTAVDPMAGINGGAKTGTSEVGQDASSTNGWFAAFNRDNHLAVGALVVGGNTGAGTAGPVARAMLLAH